MVRLCEETNDIIQETGQASLADLSRNFNLPIKYLMEVCILHIYTTREDIYMYRKF